MCSARQRNTRPLPASKQALEHTCQHNQTNWGTAKAGRRDGGASPAPMPTCLCGLESLHNLAALATSQPGSPLTWLHLLAEQRLLLGAGALQLGAQAHVPGLQDVEQQLRLEAALAAEQSRQMTSAYTETPCVGGIIRLVQTTKGLAHSEANS